MLPQPIMTATAMATPDTIVEKDWLGFVKSLTATGVPRQ
jgi:hypothetical protein